MNNQENVAKTIIKLRKEKKLTQKELAKQLGLTAQSVSKWERGLCLPDIFLLPDLCKILGIEIEELITGKKTKKSSNNNQVIMKSLKLYDDNNKKKYFKKTFTIFFLLITIIAVISIMYAINNYNKIKIYDISSNNEDLSLNGKVIFNPQNKIIMFNKFKYNDIYTGTIKEIKVKALLITLEANEKIIFSLGSLDFEEESKPQNINKALNEMSIDISYENENDTGLIEDDLDDIYIVLNYIDSNNNEKKLSFKLNSLKEFSNNSLFYHN